MEGVWRFWKAGKPEWRPCPGGQEGPNPARGGRNGDASNSGRNSSNRPDMDGRGKTVAGDDSEGCWRVKTRREGSRKGCDVTFEKSIEYVGGTGCALGNIGQSIL